MRLLILILAIFVCLSSNASDLKKDSVNSAKDKYHLYLNLGVQKFFAHRSAGFGLGLSLKSKSKPFGLSIRRNWLYGKDVHKPKEKYSFLYYDSYIKLSYQYFFIPESPTKIGVGIAKPSIYWSLFIKDMYDFYYNYMFSIQHCYRNVNLTLRMTTPMGNSYVGLRVPNFSRITFSLDLSYSINTSKVFSLFRD